MADERPQEDPLNNAADARRKYGRIATILSRHGGVRDEDALNAACLAFARYMNRHRFFVLRRGELRQAGAALVYPVREPFLPTRGSYEHDILYEQADGCLMSARFLSPSLITERDVLASAIDRALSTGFEFGLTHVDTVEEPLMTPDEGRRDALSAFMKMASDSATHRADRAFAEVRKAAEDVLEEKGQEVPEAFGKRRLLQPWNAIQHKFEQQRSAQVLKRFTRELDPEAMRLARATATPNKDLYNFLLGDGYPTRATYRRQALKAYPLFATSLQKPSPRKAIDMGYAPPHVLARFQRGQTAVDNLLHPGRDTEITVIATQKRRKKSRISNVPSGIFTGLPGRRRGVTPIAVRFLCLPRSSIPPSTGCRKSGVTGQRCGR